MSPVDVLFLPSEFQFNDGGAYEGLRLVMCWQSRFDRFERSQYERAYDASDNHPIYA